MRNYSARHCAKKVTRYRTPSCFIAKSSRKQDLKPIYSNYSKNKPFRRGEKEEN